MYRFFEIICFTLFFALAILAVIFYKTQCLHFVLRIFRFATDVLFSLEDDYSSLFCDVCELQCQTRKQYTEHSRGKSHLQKLKKSLNDECTLFVAGFPRGVKKEHLADHFSPYGTVQRCVIDKRKGTFGFVEFKTTEERNNSMQTAHFIWGRKVYIQANEQRTKKVDEKSLLDHENVLAKLRNCEEIEQAMEVLCKEISLQEKDFAERNSVCNDILSKVRKYYPESRVIIFGSTYNGLGFKGCDVDILFQPTPSFFQTIWSPLQDKDEDDVPSLRSLEKRNYFLDEIHPEIHVVLLQRILKMSQQIFSKVLYIPARCPIVKFTHVPTGLQCDVSCSNMLVVHNTKLLRTFGFLEPRFLQLTMMLRYLAKYHRIISIGNMSSYSFTMLVVFFLQNTAPPVLPSVRYLQYLADFYEETNGWNCSLCCDINRIPKSTNRESVGKLLVKFFEFYDSYDFSSVICPYTGTPIHRDQFEDFRKDDDRNFQTSPFCIRDPFQLNRNLTSFTHVRTLILFKDWVESALTVLKSGDRLFGVRELLRLFSSDSVKTLSAEFSELPSKCLALVNKVSFTMSFPPFLQQKIETMTGNVLGKICCITTHLLDYCMLFETEIVDRIEMVRSPSKSSPGSSKNKVKQHKSKSNSVACLVDVEDNVEDFIGEWRLTKFGEQTLESLNSGKPQLILSVQCTALYDTWFPLKGAVKRKKPVVISENYVAEVMEYIHEASTVMVSKDRKLGDPLNFCLDVVVHRKVLEETATLFFVFVPKDGFSEDLIKPIAVTFKTHIVDILGKALK